MATNYIESAEVIEDGGKYKQNSSQNTPPQSLYPEGWKQAAKPVWNGVLYVCVLLLLCGILVFFFPNNGIPQKIGAGTLLVYFLVFTFILLGAINIYQKGLIQFSTMFGKDGKRALDVIRWGYMFAIMGVIFLFFIFCLPFVDPAEKTKLSTIFIGNSINLLAAVTSIVGFLMLATANGCPDASRKGALRMILATIVLLGAAFMAPFAIQADGGGTWKRIFELILILIGAILFLISWHKITSIKN